MPPLTAAGRGLTRRDKEAHIAIRTGGTRLTRRDEGIPSLVLAGQGERKETRHWHWRNMPTWAIPPLDPATLICNKLINHSKLRYRFLLVGRAFSLAVLLLFGNLGYKIKVNE